MGWMVLSVSAQAPAPKASGKAKTAPAKSAASTHAGTKGSPAKSTAARSVATGKAGSSKTGVKPAATATRTATAPRTTSARATATRNTASKSKKVVVARRPPTQQQPSGDRYREIQQALADKGYYQGTLDGNWRPDSSDALKRFQREQNLEADGKIGALSLMALGLGPKRGMASAQTTKTADAAVDPPVTQPPQ
jgi:murein L,D-transpeptidase YcbB/YkuD